MNRRRGKKTNKENLEKCLTGIVVTIFFLLSWPSLKDRKKRRKKHKYIEIIFTSLLTDPPGKDKTMVQD